jgi:purine-binding chemotaxis protein CheW
MKKNKTDQQELKVTARNSDTDQNFLDRDSESNKKTNNDNERGKEKEISQGSIQESLIFGSFFLSENEFALSVSFIQEVVNPPSRYTSVPLAPSYLKGLFNLRGTVIPVLDLRLLLHLKTQENPQDFQKIAVIQLENSCVGLLFEKTGDVFKSDPDEYSEFYNRNSQDVVSGVFKKDSGKRLIQVLDVKNLFKIQNIPHDANHNNLGRQLLNKKRGQRKQCISFVVGPSRCALSISDIQEILKVDSLTESALSVGYCIGTIDLRGSMVPVIDFAALLGYRDVLRFHSDFQSNRRLVVMRLDQELFGLMVDSIESIVSYFPDELLPFPLVEQARIKMFMGCITNHGDGDILLLNHEHVLKNEEVLEMTKGHSKLYKSHQLKKGKTLKYQGQSQQEQTHQEQSHERKTYITFTIRDLYAVPIHDVKEIIEYPQNMLKPPGLKKHIRGVLNLRGNLVTIIDARVLYLDRPHLSSLSDSISVDTSQRVLVFNQKGVHFGLIVDTVESIMTFSDQDKVTLPNVLYSEVKEASSFEISEAIQVMDHKGNRVGMLVLSVSSLVDKAIKSLAA